jgi:UDP:flavonoid glycosyltransferase YjiC (YdhE family)
MRVLLTTVPALGHFHPLAPLAAAALRRGDDVVIASGENLADWVQSCSFEFAPVGMALPSVLAETQSQFSYRGTSTWMPALQDSRPTT